MGCCTRGAYGRRQLLAGSGESSSRVSLQVRDGDGRGYGCGCGCCAGPSSLLLRCPPALPPLGARRLLSIRLLQLLCESLLQVPHSSCAGPCSSSACVTGASQLLNDRPLLLLLLRESLARVSHSCCAALCSSSNLTTGARRLRGAAEGASRHPGRLRSAGPGVCCSHVSSCV